MKTLAGKRAVRLAPAFFVAAGLTLFSAAPVFAGFEWRAPAGKAKSSPVLTPSKNNIQWEENTSSMPAQKVEAVEVSAPVPLSAAPARAAMTKTAPATDVVSGFGRDLPLSAALRQVIPSDHRFTFTSGVDPDMRVSWEGERPWRQVLSDMLSSAGLEYNLRDHLIVVKPSATASAPQAAASAPSKADMIPDDMISSETRKAPGEVTLRRNQPVPLVGGGAAGLTEKEMASDALPPIQWDAETSPMPRVEPPRLETMEVEPVPLPQAPSFEEKTDVAAASLLPEARATAWSATRGQTLREVLASWSKAAHVELYWTIDYDYRLRNDVSYSGSFEQAVSKVLSQLVRTRPQPYGQLYRGLRKDGGVLIISSYDLSY